MNIKNIKRFLLIAVFSTVTAVGFCSSYYNVKDYGAKGDGVNLDSKAINKAIEKAAEQGGGTVYIPGGKYLSGSVRLKSHISLFIDQGATIIAAPVTAENNYNQEEESISTKYQDSGHSHWKNSLIWAYDMEDISIVGSGLIDGRNLYADWVKGSTMNANKAISMYRCKNVTIRDISILHGGWFAILATGVDNFTLDNVKMDTNRDGVDIDCCKNVHVSNCYVNSPYDDGICLKSTFALGYARSTENVTINGCQVSGYDEGTFLDGTYKRTKNAKYGTQPTGRIKLGTESNGGFKNVTISNCVFDYCRGLALETVDGALLEDVTISNITMRDIVNDPVFMRIGERMRGPEGVAVGKLHRIKVNNVMVYNANPSYTCTLSGTPGNDIEDVELSNITMYYGGGSSTTDVFKDIPEVEKNYPEPGMFGTIPAYGLFVRHAKNIRIENFELYTINPDKRPAFLFNDVKGANFKFVKAQKERESSSVVLKDCSSINFFESLGITNHLVENSGKKEL